MGQSENLDLLFTSLAKAQGEMSAASKDCSNPFFKSRYADLGSIWAACREPLSRNGLTVLQTVQQTEQGDVLFSMLGHSSGQWISSTMPIRVRVDGKGGNELQALGAAITYLRRFSLAALVGVAPDDDNDGNNSAYKATQAHQNPPAPIIVPIISITQLTELRSLLGQCDADYIAKIMKYLVEQKISSLENLPITFYDMVKGRVEKHLFADDTMAAIVGET